MGIRQEQKTNSKIKRSLLLLALCSAIIHSDQGLLAPNLSAAANDIFADDITTTNDRDAKLGGGLAFGFFLVGAPAAFFFGAAADSMDRIYLLQIILWLGAIGCFTSALSLSYWHLFVARSITGASLAGGMPLLNSILSDMVGADQRTVEGSRIGLASTFGSMTGRTLAGFLGPNFGWRSPFYIVSIFMVLIASQLTNVLKDPPREEGSQVSFSNGTSSVSRSFRTGFMHWKRVLTIPTFWLIMLQCIPGCVPWGVIGTFLPDYLHTDSPARLPVEHATIVMNIFTFGCVIGTYVGGSIGQWLYDQSPRLPPLLMFSAGTIGVFPMWYLITSTPSSLFMCSFVAGVGGFFASQTGSNIKAMLNNVTKSNQRGVAFASFTLFDDVGKGAGPAVIAYFIQKYGRQMAFAMSMLCWVPCAILCGLTVFTVIPDEKKATQDMKKTNGASYEMAGIIVD